MPERSWTTAQQNAIEARGGSLLVSAAAGSGKTAVLVERVIGLICDRENPVDVDRLLIVTFSNAAASEMRQRIGARLTALSARDRADRHLLRQQALLQKAQISTIHAFCLSLIRSHFQDLDISPDFSLADQSELDLMRAECAGECIEQFYAMDETGAFTDLVELLSGGRDDSRVVETILKIYDFSRSHPFYESWLEERPAIYRTDAPISETPWGISLLAHARETLSFALQTARKALEVLADADEAVQNAYMPAFSSDLRQLEECLSAANAGDWDTLAGRLSSFSFERLRALRGGGADKDRLKAMRDAVKDAVRTLGEKYLNATEADFREDLRDLAPKVELLFRLVLAFGRALDARKAEKKKLDFSDLEHLALRLLAEQTENGVARTARAREIAEQYDYVLVDEYQDTNEAQDLIFSCVSRGEQNLFMVGDVKQSIYSFRQAMPELFLEKRERFFPYDGQNFPAAVSLDMNFRSRPEVTAAVNFIFSLIMSRSLGEIDYDAGESLKCGARYPAGDDVSPELWITPLSGYDGDLSATEAEAAHVADKIRAMLEGGFRVAEGEAMRRARPGDFCILLRSPKGRADAFVRALSDRGVPARTDSASGFLSVREVSMVVSLLCALDNPLLDVELVAALLSPLFDFTADDIARIRLRDRGAPFFTALAACAEEGDEKAADFLALFRALRADAAIMPADRLLLRLYDKTDALTIVSAMPMGDRRRANLLLLAEYATHFHALGHRGLSGFASFLRRLRERGGDLAPAAARTGADAVSILSVHRSKGLEFPVVILADTARQFNRRDLYAGTLLHSRYGFACVRRDPKTRAQYTTIPQQAVRLELERSLLSEEMRILYVALTRAREKLIISAAIKTDLTRKLSGLAGELVGGRLSAGLAAGAAGISDWVLMALLHHESLAGLREAGGCVNLQALSDGVPWRLEIAGPEDAAPESSETSVSARAAQADPAILAGLQSRTSFSYPFAARTQIPTKMAVSTAAKGERNIAYRFTRRPAILTGRSLTAAEKGNALHKFMQFADYARARDNPEAEIERMAAGAYLSRAEAESLSVEKLAGFFRSELAARIFDSPQVWRELRFMAEFGRDELGDVPEGMDDESRVVLQGVADCIFVENGEAVIVDYKTDFAKDASELAEKYTRQMELYQKILTASLGLPVKECILYSFGLPGAVPVIQSGKFLYK